MRTTWVIARRQFASYFNSPVAYIVLSILLLLVGFFFWRTFFLDQVATVREMFTWISLFFILGAPALTMGLLAEERRSGTIELLMTMPVKDWEVIAGKYLGVLGVFVVFLVLTLPYPISVSTLGQLDWGPVASGYLGMFLTGAAMLAIGLVASSWTENQLIALFVAAGLCFVLGILDKVIMLLPAGAASVLEWISFNSHLGNMARGVIDSRDVIYFASIIAFTLALSFRSLESRRWR